MGLIVFSVHFYIFLRKSNDKRVQNVKLLLLTATKEGPVVEAIQHALISAGVASEDYCVPRGPGRSKYKVLDLFGDRLVEKPYRWTEASLPERACMAAALMAGYLWWRRWQSAQILFILPGEKELYDVRNAMNLYDFGFDWEHHCILGETPHNEISDITDTLEKTVFQTRASCRFPSGHGWRV